jgi:tetratricopeptide (TPR) repeat protein
MALCACFLSVLPIAQGAEPIAIAMKADRWQTKENTELLRQQDEGDFKLLYLRPEPKKGKYRMYNEMPLSKMNAQSGETSRCSVTIISQLINGAHSRFISGEYAESYRLERAALACYDASSTPAYASARTAILSRLGELSWLRGRIGEAETWLIQALAIHEKDPGAVPTPGYAATLIGLATIDGERRQYVKAEPLVRQALEVCGLLPTPDAVSCRRTAMNTLGNLHAGLQDPEGAERVYRNALAIENAGEPDIITAALLHNLAVVQQDQGRVGEAEKHYREALSLRCRLLPRGHSDTRKTVKSLRLLLQHSGRKQESRQLRLTPRPE